MNHSVGFTMRNRNKANVISQLKKAVAAAEMMGQDTTDPALMGGFLKKIIGKIKEKRAKRIAEGNEKDFSLSTPAGVFNVGDSGVGFVGKTGTGEGSGSTFPEMGNKKILIGAGVAALALIFLMRRGK